MPRQPRLDHPGGLYHLINRGIERRSIFLDKSDYEYFVSALGDLLLDGVYDCYAWVLMPNHFHLVVERGKTPISRLMSRLCTKYAGYFNRRHKRAGRLFQNRYKAILCDRDEYFKELVAYVHLNPLKAKMVKTLGELERFPWSGHRILMGREERPWQNVEAVLSEYSNDPRKAREGYLRFLEAQRGVKRDLSGGGLLRSAGGWEVVTKRKYSERERFDTRILGEGGFVTRVLDQTEEKEFRPPSFEQILNRVISHMGLEKKELVKPGKSNRGGKEGRAVVSYVAVRYGKERLMDVAERLGISAPSACNLMKAGEGMVEGNRDLKNALLSNN